MLYFRDALECFKYLFGNPLFSDYMDFVPRREYADREKNERLYNEIMTGDRAWMLQVSILTMKMPIADLDGLRIYLGLYGTRRDSGTSNLELR